MRKPGSAGFLLYKILLSLALFRKASIIAKTCPLSSGVSFSICFIRFNLKRILPEQFVSHFQVN